MKRERREIYQILSNEIDWTICSFCKYAFSSGGCCDCEIECHHPLNNDNCSWEIEKCVNNAMEMGDCWLFKPAHSIDFITDIVSIVLSKGWDGGASWWQDKTGQWKVAGRPQERYFNV